MKPHGVAIRALRRASGIGLRELEQRTGLDKGYLSKLERGQRGASPATLRHIATAMNVPLEAITRENT